MKLFEFDSSASFFEFSFESFSVSFSNAFFNSFRSAVNESFSVFQAEARNFTDNFDNADFFVASGLENDVEFGFFFSRSSASSRSSRLRTPSRCISPSLRAGRRPTRTARTVWV